MSRKVVSKEPGAAQRKTFPIVVLIVALFALITSLPSPAQASSGPVVAWGDNSSGQCNIPSPNSGFVAITGGLHHSLGLKSDGSVVAWGLNDQGQCNVPFPNSGFVAIAGGGYYSLGLKSDGSVVAWGDNGSGQCNVPPPNSGFVAIAGGGLHGLGLKSDGSVVAWGGNSYGQCNVPPPNSGFVAIAGGGAHSLGLKSDGSVVAWGFNTSGQCNVPPPNSGFVAIEGGDQYSLGLKSDGTVVAWGDNSLGQCNVPSPNSGFVAIAAGGNHSLGLKSDGTVVAWEWNGYGQCSVPSPNSGFAAIAGGGAHSLGLKGSIYNVTATVPGGHGTALPAYQPVNPGDDATVNFTPAPGYHIESITDNTTPVTITNPYVITGVAADHDVVVTFDTGYNVTATVPGGHGTALPAYQPVNPGDDATVNFTPAPGYHVATITDNGASETPTNSYVISNVQEDHDVEVTFSDTYTVTASVTGGHGTVDSPNPQNVTPGDDATVNFTPALGYHVATITDNGASETPTNSYVISNVQEDHFVEVRFAINTYTVTASVPGGHGAAGPTPQTVNYGDDATIAITPALGYHIVTIKDNGTLKTPVSPYVITGVTANHDVEVTFGPNTNPVGPPYPPPDPPIPPVNPDPYIPDGPTQPSSVIYLAEGSTAWGFDCYISIENPNNQAVTAEITYMTSSGPVTRPDVKLPALSQTTINPRNDLGDTDFSTRIKCKEGKLIAADRTMSWTGKDVSGTPYKSPEGSCSSGVSCPAKKWYLPEGCSAFGFETWLLIQNPNSQTARCTVTYMTEWSGPKTLQKTVAPNSRATFNMKDDIGEENASIKVESNLPVIPERAQYRNNRREGADSIGATVPLNDFFLAEGSTAWGFTEWVLVQNPNSEPTDVTLTYMTSNGPKAQAPFTMPANSRKTIKVNDQVPNSDLSTKVHGSKPILAERAMYWSNTPDGLEACHDQIGSGLPHSTFYLADGQTSDTRETWTLVQNPNSSAVEIGVYYLPENGTPFKAFKDTVPAGSRKTYNMVDAGITGRASVLVETLDTSKLIMVERAMYWNSRGAGTDSGGFWRD